MSVIYNVKSIKKKKKQTLPAPQDKDDILTVSKKSSYLFQNKFMLKAFWKWWDLCFQLYENELLPIKNSHKYILKTWEMKSKNDFQ